MPLSRSVEDAPESPSVADPALALTCPRVRTRRRFWWLLALTFLVSALFYPPLWHVLLRRLTVAYATRHGYELSIGRMQGGPFDPIHAFDIRCHRSGTTTDVHVSHAELTLAWQLPDLESAKPGIVQRLSLVGINGICDLAAADSFVRPTSRGLTLSGTWLDRLVRRLMPTEIFVQGDDITLRRKRYQMRLRGLRLSLERDNSGFLLAREVDFAGPGFANTLLNRHGQTLWQDDRLTLSGLEFGPGVRLITATLGGAHLGRQHLDWEGKLAVLGGEVRVQGAVNFVHPGIALEMAGTLQGMPVAPLARLVGFTGAAGGSVEQGSFSFRGDLEDWPSAQMWLAAQATDFRWGERDWQKLDLRATVLHRRIQVNRLELQQSRNRLSLSGECPLFLSTQGLEHWWESGFACNVDARLEDLRDLTRLFGARLPEMEGRMSVNGTLETAPDRSGINGYLNVEGSRLRFRGAPLDYLHSTLLFRGLDLNVADLQATHGNDYFAGRGFVSLDGTFRRQGELQCALSDPTIYLPALAGVFDLENTDADLDRLRTPIRLDGVFFGPDHDGKNVFLTFDDLLRLPVPPSSLDGASGPVLN